MDKITESLQKALRAKDLKFNTLYNSLGKDGLSDMTSTSLHLSPTSETETRMSVVIDIDPSENQFYVGGFPFVAYSKSKKSEMERFVSKWNNGGPGVTIVFEEDPGIPIPGMYRIGVHISGFAPENGHDVKTWEKYINVIVDTTSNVLDMINEIDKDEPLPF